MRKVGWRWAAAAWVLTMAAIGLGVATCSAPGDGSHYDFCARDTSVPPATASVTLTEQDVVPVLHIRLGQSFTAKVDGGASRVVEPKVTHRGVVCQATRSAPAAHLAVTFVGTNLGTTTLGTLYDASGGSSAVNVGLFRATIVVLRSIG
jgi:type 1 fimbria pilin